MAGWIDTANTPAPLEYAELGRVNALDTTGINGDRPVAVLSPSQNDTLVAGQTCAIRWDTSTVHRACIDFSSDGGKTWEIIVGASINPSDPSNGNYPWTVPGVFSSNCRIRVHDYINASIEGVSGRFAIVDHKEGDVGVICAGLQRGVDHGGGTGRYFDILGRRTGAPPRGTAAVIVMNNKPRLNFPPCR
jgi:hypothetical protein